MTCQIVFFAKNQGRRLSVLAVGSGDGSGFAVPRVYFADYAAPKSLCFCLAGKRTSSRLPENRIVIAHPFSSEGHRRVGIWAVAF